MDLDGGVEVLLELERQQRVDGLLGGGGSGGRCGSEGSSERLHGALCSVVCGVWSYAVSGDCCGWGC